MKQPRLTNMRTLWLGGLLAITAAAQVSVLSIPRVDVIEFFGLHNVTRPLAQQALGLSPGSPLPDSKGDTEDRLLDLDQVVNASLEAVYDNNGKTILYVGIEERGGPHYAVRATPGGASTLPEEIVAAYRAYELAAHNAEVAGKTGEDLRSGYPLATDLPTRAAQQKFTALVDDNFALVREVLRDSIDDYHRAIAAYVLPYATKRAEVVDDLRDALTDADPTVRKNAVHSLTGLALLESKDPASKVRVSGGMFLEMLNSLVWSDRMQAAIALETLTLDRDQVLINQIKGTPLDALIEMSRWQTEAHAYPAFQIVGRVAGLTDPDIRDAWRRAGRETVIGQALAKTR